MSIDIWNSAKEILKFDNKINSVIYTSFIEPMKQVSYDDNGLLILSCINEFTLNYVKDNADIFKRINEAVNLIAKRNVTINLILKDDENAYIASVISANKVITNENTSNNPGISSEFTFANFIVGDSNRFAHASAMAVADYPGIPQRNPLFLWSNPGLGKTHLMKAIGYSITCNHPEMSVIYTTCEQFTNAYVACMNDKNYEAFRNKYRTVDVLLIDDIQFLIDKEGIQIEFFNTFEALISAGKQIVITCDKAPRNLVELDSRLTSRFQNGMAMDIQPPDFETRKAILISKLTKDNIEITDEIDDIINYVCENVTKNVRELNGAYNTISSYYALNNGKLTLQEAIDSLASIISPGTKKVITADIIIEAVARYYGLTPDKLKSNQRSADIKNPRNVAICLCRDIMDMTLTKIGTTFGKKHSTVINSLKVVDSNPELQQDVEAIKKKILES